MNREKSAGLMRFENYDFKIKKKQEWGACTTAIPPGIEL